MSKWHKVGPCWFARSAFAIKKQNRVVLCVSGAKLYQLLQAISRKAAAAAKPRPADADAASRERLEALEDYLAS